MQQTKKKVLIILCAALAALLAGYGAVCVIAASNSQIFPHTAVQGIPVGGLTVEQAAEKLAQELPPILEKLEIPILTYEETAGEVDLTAAPERTLPLRDLAAAADSRKSAEKAFEAGREGNVLQDGFTYLRRLFAEKQLAAVLLTGEGKLSESARTLAEGLSAARVESAHRSDGESLFLTKPKDGRHVAAPALEEKLAAALESGSFTAIACPYTVLTVEKPTAAELAEKIQSPGKNAGYDAKTKEITREQMGIAFDPAEAQRLLDAAEPGTEVKIPAEITLPQVTAEQLEGVLFRNVIGTYTTHVGGSAARRGNVKKSAASFSGMVLNSGELFTYNDAVGKRSAANGYFAAPAYVQGETVNEIGGGICQTSTTLYMAALLANLEIVTRSAHRYVPAYVPKGMDATVSWGEPEFRFRNDTDYPIRLVTSYSAKNDLTVTIYGTKLNDNYVKITNEVLGSTPFKEIRHDDPTLAPGTVRVKQTPYTGYQVRTYRNLYSGDGKLISSKFEASSNYKVRDRIVLVGPAPVSKPVEELPVPVVPGEPEIPSGGENPVTPIVPETPPVKPVDPAIPPVKPVDPAVPPVKPVDPATPPVDPATPPLTPPVDPAVQAARENFPRRYFA